MLNPGFSSKIFSENVNRYILPDNIGEIICNNNSILSGGPELRLQSVYKYEIWKKIYALGLDRNTFQNKKILDVCCGKGFLSYHLLSDVKLLELTMTDISLDELQEAKKLIDETYSDAKVEYLRADILNSNIKNETFDIIIGNSFLHHFYNIPYALQEIRKMLKPGGLFITLHEPTIPAVAYESANTGLLYSYLKHKDNYIEKIRYVGDGIAPNAGADVWIFKDNELENLLYEAGFQNVVMKNWHLLRPILVGKMNWHLNSLKQNHEKIEEVIFKNSIYLDSLLNKILPSEFFASVSFVVKNK